MAENKTQPTDADVNSFIASLEKEGVRDDCRELVDLMTEVTGSKPRMWGPSIVGFGSMLLRYESGREMDWFYVGFSPRKQNLTLYIMNGFRRYQDLLSKLGKHSTGKSCLYIKRLNDIDRKVLREMVEQSVAFMKTKDASKS